MAVTSDPTSGPPSTAALDSAAEVDALARAATLDPAWYGDPDHHRREVGAVFRSGWSCVGVIDDVAAGGWMAVAAGDVPVVVTRSPDGDLRAFLNACRHRGAPVADGCGTGRMLRCPYHAWSYRLDGSLATSHGMEGAVGFDPDDFGLLEVGVAQWSRFVFVCPTAEPPAFDVGPLGAAIAPYATERFELAQRKTTERRFNWKLLLENYSENFHTPWVHPQLTWQQWEYPIVADGRVVLAWDRPLHPDGPVEEALAGATPLDEAWRGVAETQIDDVFLAGAYFAVFPNLLVSMFPRYMSAFWLTPVAVDRTTVSYVRMWHPEVDEDRRTDDLAASDEVAAQDLDICEALQRTASAGVDPRGRLSPEHENGVFHLHELVRRSLADAR